jgi:flagellin
VGAYTNGLEYSLNNIVSQSENLTTALSNITDVDMAKEAMEMTKD